MCVYIIDEFLLSRLKLSRLAYFVCCWVQRRAYFNIFHVVVAVSTLRGISKFIVSIASEPCGNKLSEVLAQTSNQRNDFRNIVCFVFYHAIAWRML